MRTYNIYMMQNDEKIGEVVATNVVAAEIKACEIYNMGANDIYAISKED